MIATGDEQSERIAAALAGHRQTCPSYHLPCWACTVLHVFTGIVRSVTQGRFRRFENRRFDHFDTNLWWEAFSRDPRYQCPHCPRPSSSGDHYWVCEDASTLDPALLEILERGQVRVTNPSREDMLRHETAVHVIAGGRACPRYELPCWVCGVLNTLTFTLRSVTHGRFSRFRGWSFAWTDHVVWRPWAEDPMAMCGHHPELEPDMVDFWENQNG